MRYLMDQKYSNYQLRGLTRRWKIVKLESMKFETFSDLRSKLSNFDRNFSTYDSPTA